MGILLPFKVGINRAGRTKCAMRTYFLTNWQLRPAFSRKKNFENPSKTASKTDQVRGKNLIALPFSSRFRLPCDSIWLCSCIFVGLWGTTCFALTSFQPFQKVVFIFRIYRRFYTLVIAISSWNLFPHMWQCKLQSVYICM